MQWRWRAVSPEVELTLTLDSTNPDLIERVEASAKANGIVLERLDWPVPKDVVQPIAPDYADSAE